MIRSFINSFLGGPDDPPPRKPRARRTRLGIERFEDRVNPTTMIYHGGHLLQQVEVETVYLGAAWASNPTLQAQANAVDQFFKDIVDSPYVTMLGGQNQYDNGGQSIRGGSWTGRDVVSTPQGTSTSITESQIRGTIQDEQTAVRLHTEDGNRLYFVFTAPGIVITAASGQTSNPNFYGYHGNSSSDANYFFAAVPYPGNGTPAISGLTTDQQLTAVASHELAESITDPGANSGFGDGWYDDATGKEVADVTVISSANVGLVAGYTVQKIWSNTDARVILPGDRSVLASSFFGSDEYLNKFVGSQYTTLLHRTGSPGDISVWVSSIKANHLTDEQVIGKFLASPEYVAKLPQHAGASIDQRWVEQVYRDVMGREVDPGGLTTWMTRVAQAGREAAGTEIARSTEAETRVVNDVTNGYYKKYLNRTADPIGLAGWVSSLVSGTLTREQVQVGIIASNEYFDRWLSTNEGYVDHLYQDILGRSGTGDPGRAGWLDYLRHG